VRDRSQALVEKYQLSGVGSATLESAAGDALHFKPMTLDCNFKCVRVAGLLFVCRSVRPQISSFA
jgi:hypothetical protein